MIVCKFGGSSVASKKALLNVLNIIKRNSDRKIIVISAIGKRDCNDEKLTDLLINAFNKRKTNEFNSIYSNLEFKMQNFSNELGINPHLHFNFELFKEQIKNSSVTYEYVISRGEYFTAIICSRYLNANFIDSINLIEKNHSGKIIINKVLTNLNNYDLNKVNVIPGFYCTNQDKKITLLERGGGDTTGAILAQAINADEYENYTDVNGVLTIDNKITLNSKTINELSAGQFANIINDGARVFSLGAIPYLIKFNGKTHIKNTFNSEELFTSIGKKSDIYYFDSIKKYHCFINKKKHSKNRFINDIFNVFMTNKKPIGLVFWTNQNIFVEYKNTDNLITNKIDGIKLTLYKYNRQTVRRIKKSCANYKIKMQMIILPSPYLKAKLYFFGKISKSFIDEIISLLEKKNTPLE